MARVCVVTGSASGIGQATRRLLESEGDRVIGVDLHDAEVIADLTSAAGRATMVEGVGRLSGQAVDAVFAVAGLAQPVAATIAVNYFGTLATLTGLRPFLRAATAPRAVAVSSMAALLPVDDQLVAALRAGDELAALSRAELLAEDPESLGRLIYSSSKRALSQWVRRMAPSSDWAGEAIALNAVSPGVIATPMTAHLISTEEKKAALLEMVPMPLNGIAAADVVAHVLAWLGSPENTHLCGQIVYVDGGSDAVIRGDSVW